MTDRLQEVWTVALNAVIQFLPKLLSGLLLLVVGWAVAWAAKRVLIQLMILLRMERFLTRFRWGGSFGKADIRYGFYNLVGNILFVLVLLTFLDLALLVWDLHVLSDQLSGVILILPRLVKALVIGLLGLLAARWAARAVALRAFRRDPDHAALASWFVRLALILVFGGMALYELDVGRPVLLISISVLLVALSLLALLAAYDVIRGRRETGTQLREPDSGEVPK